MKLKTTILAGAAVLTVGVASVVGVSSVSAQSANGDTLIDRIATRFNLNRENVSGVFNEVREERQTERQAEATNRLQQKVDEGTITSDQKTLIENKHEEWKTQREALRNQDLSWEDRHEAMEQIREEMVKWAEENGVEDVLPMHEGMGNMGGMGQGRRGGWNN